MAIWLIRHAQSKFNAFGTMLPDIELSDQGKIQAKSLSGNPSLVIISTLKRARETLEHSNIKYDIIMVSELCCEVRDGNIINHLVDEISYSETDEELGTRIRKFYDLLQEQREIHKEIYVITHALFIYNFIKFWIKKHPSVALQNVNHIYNCQKLNLL